ncbi:hypothetical protein Pla123a_24070 [Posidoniimonas polymericola]|uniref:Uncharacterized protein n=1 Tax=Posidoniimonas polymericola TaxID=2528002 RepID=A0A5C5YPU3_9BACT|nr:hypothetical protein [Posidoniimonas polymericola]TWT76982.1 hypothetical protein Pla123a_24070 [Posidoniimonas polymericola]
MDNQNKGRRPSFRGALSAWLQGRLQECTHCRVCSHDVTPLDHYCANCGQQDPALVSKSAALSVVVLAGLLACGGVTALVGI